MVALRKILYDDPIIGASILILLFYCFFIFSMLVYYYTSYFVGVLVENISFLFLFLIRFFITFSLIGFYCLFVVPIGFHLPNGKQTIREYLISIKLKKNDQIRRYIIVGLVCGIIYGYFYFIGFLIFSEKFPFLDLIIIFGIPQDISELGILLYLSVLTWAIWEEILFRGVILNILLKNYSTKNAIFIDGVIFGLYHLFNLLGGVDLFFILMQVTSATFGGLIYAYMYIKTENLVPCMICHYLHNVLLSIMEQWFSNALLHSAATFIIVPKVFGGIISPIVNYFVINIFIKKKRFDKILA